MDSPSLTILARRTPRGENALVGSATFEDIQSSQHLSINQNDQRLLEKAGA